MPMSRYQVFNEPAGERLDAWVALFLLEWKPTACRGMRGDHWWERADGRGFLPAFSEDTREAETLVLLLAPPVDDRLDADPPDPDLQRLQHRFVVAWCGGPFEGDRPGMGDVRRALSLGPRRVAQAAVIAALELP